jgi:hypothetical protein
MLIFNYFKEITITLTFVFMMLVSVDIANQMISAQSTSIVPLDEAPQEDGIANITLNPPQQEPLAAFPAPVPYSDEVIEELERRTEKTLNRPQIDIVNETAAIPPNGTALKLNQSNTANISNTQGFVQPAITRTSLATTTEADSQLKVFINKTVTPSQSRSVVGEPSVANEGSTVFFTGNWYAARSTDNGTSWRYLNPLQGMGDFCCDQDVIYDPNHEVFVWYRQGASNDLTGENRIRIGISPDATNWWFYNIRPTDLNPSWTNQWLDYPHLALSNNYLYFTSNMFNIDNDFTRTVIVKLPMEDLVNARVPTADLYFSNQVGTFTPVQGAKESMYWAAHADNQHMVLYRWDEASSSNAIVRQVVEIPSWTINPSLYDCPTPTGDDNWCARSDDRILNGWISGGKIGFFWNVDKGGEFPWPYVNAAVFDAASMTYQGRPLLWSPDFAVLYAYASPNEKDQLGLIATFGGGEIEPSIGGAINTVNDNGNLRPWNLIPLINGTHVPEENEWGDYLRIRPYNATESAWTATGYTLQGGSSMSYIEPRLFVFGTTSPSPSPSSIQASLTTDTTSTSLMYYNALSSKIIQTDYLLLDKKKELMH